MADASKLAHKDPLKTSKKKHQLQSGQEDHQNVPLITRPTTISELGLLIIKLNVINDNGGGANPSDFRILIYLGDASIEHPNYLFLGTRRQKFIYQLILGFMFSFSVII